MADLPERVPCRSDNAYLTSSIDRRFFEIVRMESHERPGFTLATVMQLAHVYTVRYCVIDRLLSDLWRLTRERRGQCLMMSALALTGLPARRAGHPWCILRYSTPTRCGHRLPWTGGTLRPRQSARAARYVLCAWRMRLLSMRCSVSGAGRTWHSGHGCSGGRRDAGGSRAGSQD